jgi:autoinducer 2-degrading protein
MFTLLVQVDVDAALLEEFTAAIIENARQSVAHDPGCLRFDVLQVRDLPTRWIFYEAYTDEGSWQRHRLSPHFIAYKAVADRALLAREALTLTPILVMPAS